MRYSRNGALQINDQGQLSTMEGYPVISLGGTPILFSAGDSDITITGTGQVTTNLGGRGTLQLVSFPNEQELEKTGDNLFSAPFEPQADPTIRVTQGVLESSNVQGVREMSRLVEVQRAYELQANLIRQASTMRQEAIRLLGRLNG